MRKFRDMDKRGLVENATDTQLDTIHQNTISEIRVFSGSKSGVDKISTVGVDGQMVVWDLRVTHFHIIYLFKFIQTFCFSL